MNPSSFRRARRNFLRQMLRQGGALGLASASPLLLTSCGFDAEDSTPEAGVTPLQDARETRTLHFDLSLAPVIAPALHAARSQQHRSQLVEHTDASRAAARAALPALASIDDARLTHYLEAVDLPAEALQTIWTKGVSPITGGEALIHGFLSVPTSAQKIVAARAAARTTPAPLSAKALAYNIRPTLGLADGQDDGLEQMVTNYDTAVVLIFHHPEIMNLKPDLGAEIKNRIAALPCASGDATCKPFAAAVAVEIGKKVGLVGHPCTKPGSWATLIPLSDANGQPLLDEIGAPIYKYELADEVAAAVSAAVRQIMKLISDDPLFKGTNWHTFSGLAHQESDGQKATALAAAAAVGSGFNVSATQPVGSGFSGIQVIDLQVTDPAKRAVQMRIKNHYLRFLSIYVQYRDSNGKVLPVENAGGLDSDESKFLKMVGSNQQLMGIPFQGGDVLSSGIDFTLPPAASSAVVKFGSLGLGGDPFATQEAVLGASLTLALNIGLPALLLAEGVYANVTGGIQKLLDDQEIMKGLGQAILKIFLKGSPRISTGLYGTLNSNSFVQTVTALGGVALQVVMANMGQIVKAIALNVAAAQAAGAAAGPIGVAFRVISMLADAAAIGVSIGEVCSSQAVEDNTVTLTMPSTVRISRDTIDFQFPATATGYIVEATYDGGAKPKRMLGSVAKGTADPIVVPIPDVASGGTVQVSVVFYSASDCIVGTGNSGLLANLPDTAGLIDITIKETVVALNEQTQYQHDVILTMQGGVRAWLPGGAPTRTRADLCNGSDGAICALNGITVHTATGMAGYGYFAGGQPVAQCSGSGAGGGGGGAGSTGGSFHMLQNQFLGKLPDSGFKLLPCGATQPIGVVYDSTSPAVGGRNFFLQPADDGYHVRSVDLTPGAGFDLNQTFSWGRFSSPQESLVVLPSGYLIGVNRDTHKMEVLRLPKAAVDGAREPAAVPFASIKAGQGTREGLFDTPVAVATFGGAVLVLEQGNARIQALDPAGNPVKLFAGGTSNLLKLKVETGATYLDIGAEGKGYMYVLSYTGGGNDPHDYHLDVYTPNGDFLTRTEGMAAARLAVDTFRNVYTLNYAPVVGATRVEPSVSQWLPSPDAACPKTSLPMASSGAANVASCLAA